MAAPIETVTSGAWEYAPGVWLPAHVVASERDFWHELGQDPTPADASGRLYYFVLRSLDAKGFFPASPAFSSLDEARAAAQVKAGGIEWGAEPSPTA